MVTSFGEVLIEKRCCGEQETGERRFLLDEVLGLEESKRLSPWMRELAVTVATEMPYERAARFLSTMTLETVDMRRMSLWQEVQKVGKEVVKKAEEKRVILFEYGVVPEGKIKSTI